MSKSVEQVFFEFEVIDGVTWAIDLEFRDGSQRLSIWIKADPKGYGRHICYWCDKQVVDPTVKYSVDINMYCWEGTCGVPEDWEVDWVDLWHESVLRLQSKAEMAELAKESYSRKIYLGSY